MICCIQRVLKASVKAGGVTAGEIGPGLVVFFGVEKGDDESFISWAADKITNLRIFEDENGRMSRSVSDTGGSVLIVSQFTLAGDASRGRRPDFGGAEAPDRARIFYEKFMGKVKDLIGAGRTASGVFGAHMEVSVLNDGPVTILLEKKK